MRLQQLNKELIDEKEKIRSFDRRHNVFPGKYRLDEGGKEAKFELIKKMRESKEECDKRVKKSKEECDKRVNDIMKSVKERDNNPAIKAYQDAFL